MRSHHFLAPPARPPARRTVGWLCPLPLTVSRMRNELDCDRGGRSARTRFVGEQTEALRGLSGGGLGVGPASGLQRRPPRQPPPGRADGRGRRAPPLVSSRGDSPTTFVKRVLCPDEVGRCAVGHGWPRVPGRGTDCSARLLSVSPTLVPGPALHPEPPPPVEAVSPGLGFSKWGSWLLGYGVFASAPFLVAEPLGAAGLHDQRRRAAGWLLPRGLWTILPQRDPGQAGGVRVAVACPLRGFRSDLKLPPIPEPPWVMRVKASRLSRRGVGFGAWCWRLWGSCLGGRNREPASPLGEVAASKVPRRLGHRGVCLW